MKRNPIAGQNQRIQRMTESTLVVGIDIAKERHASQAMDYRGITLSSRALWFPNAHDGFEQLEEWIRGLQAEHGKDDVIIGMESTGHYWLNLANWLVARSIEVVLVNPATTKRNKENRDNSPSKSDPKDALVIAECVTRGYYTPYRPKEERFQRLHTLMSHREHWITEATRLTNQLHRWLDIFFPEYISVFPEIGCPRSLATLREFPVPSDLAPLTPEHIVEAWGRHLQRPGGARGLRKAVRLLECARQSVGQRIALEEARLELRHLLDAYERVQAILSEYHALAEELLRETPGAEAVQSVGLPVTLTAAVLGFGGDLRQFEHGNQLLRKAGLNLAERDSGKHKGKIKLSKRGSSRLRKYLYLAALYLVTQNPVFRRWHYDNIHQKRMTGTQSLIKLAGKLARMLVAMVQRQDHFNPEKALAHRLAA